MDIRLSGYLPNSLVNGEGLRTVVFAQGCRHNCKGCFNKHTHDPQGGQLFDIVELSSQINRDMFEGVTFSGGDPFEQALAFGHLANRIQTDDIWAYTGYTFEELINGTVNQYYLLRRLKVLVDGKFIEELKDPTLKYRGSSNQRIIDVQESLKSEEVILYGNY